MIPLKKIDRLSGAVFINALRLHIDAIYLFRKKSFPSAFQLSVLSQEEIGKALFLEEVYWQALPNKITEINDIEYEKMIDNIFLSHTHKQQWFSSHVDDYMLHFSKHKKYPKFLEDINKGVLEIQKQNATYVGFKKKGKTIDWESKYIFPKKSEKEVKKHITRVNDYIVNLAEGCRRGTHSVDTDSVDKILTIKLAQKLERLWPYKSSVKTKELINIRKFNVDDEY